MAASDTNHTIETQSGRRKRTKRRVCLVAWNRSGEAFSRAGGKDISVNHGLHSNVAIVQRLEFEAISPVKPTQTAVLKS
jgi:hypothetical protein